MPQVIVDAASSAPVLPSVDPGFARALTEQEQRQKAEAKRAAHEADRMRRVERYATADTPTRRQGRELFAKKVADWQKSAYPQLAAAAAPFTHAIKELDARHQRGELREDFYQSQRGRLARERAVAVEAARFDVDRTLARVRDAVAAERDKAPATPLTDAEWNALRAAKDLVALDVDAAVEAFLHVASNATPGLAREVRVFAAALAAGDPRYAGRLDAVLEAADVRQETMFGIAADHVAAMTDRVGHQLAAVASALATTGDVTALDAGLVQDFVVPNKSTAAPDDGLGNVGRAA